MKTIILNQRKIGALQRTYNPFIMQHDRSRRNPKG